MKTYKELLQHCKKAVNDGVQYVYGTKMEVLTLTKYNMLKNMYGSVVWDSDKNKIGKMCCDCSGLISSCTGIVRNSTAYKTTATETASIEDLKKNWTKYVGWGIWLQGHIGVVSDTVGYYYAMDGSGRNAVHYPLSKNDWTLVVKLKDIDYSQEAQEVQSETSATKYKVGQHVVFSTCYKSSSDPISAAIGSNKMARNHGIITKIVAGARNPYLLDGGLCWVNDGDIRSLYAGVSYYPKYTGSSVSIVDALQRLKIDSSFANRKKIAEKNGIKGYTGTAEQNGTLLALLKSGKLIKL